MPATTHAPNLHGGRPAKGFSTNRAQRWILAAAIVTGIIYAMRRLVEPSLTQVPSSGNKAAQVAGAGSPPPTLAHWAIAYGAGFALLGLVSLSAPEVAASLAMLELAGTVLTNGFRLYSDLQALEQGNITPSDVAAQTQPAPSGGVVSGSPPTSAQLSAASKLAAASTLNIKGPVSALTSQPPAGVTLLTPAGVAYNSWFDSEFNRGYTLAKGGKSLPKGASSPMLTGYNAYVTRLEPQIFNQLGGGFL